MKKTLLSIITATAALASVAQYPYRIIAPVDAEDGSMVYLSNYDTGERIDSAIVKEKAVTFKGEMDEPFVVRMLASNGQRLGTLILEQGTVAFNQERRAGVGGMLNDQYNAFTDSLSKLEQKYQEADEAKRKAILADYKDFSFKTMKENEDNPIGYLVFLDMAYQVPTPEFLELVEQYPDMKQYRRVRNLIDSSQRKLATSEGGKMVDFETTFDGNTQRLSDYVGKGKYVLADFWASWCGPCVREIKNLKEIYEQYHPSGLEILGVAVWDKPEDTQGAIQRLQIPWSVMLNTGNVATDAYGIPAIPCIIIFDPEGNIVARDITGTDLKAKVAELIK